MDVRNCKMCGALFNYSGNAVCPACNKKLEEKFVTVKEYIRDNPTSSISKVAEETEVPVQQLKRWVREERLCFSKDSGVMVQCEKCGKPITTGRYCQECKHSMTQSFESLYNQNSPEVKKKSYGSAKMRFIDK
jgi:flagellar operon protein (TIGR03826 family)